MTQDFDLLTGHHVKLTKVEDIFHSDLAVGKSVKGEMLFDLELSQPIVIVHEVDTEFNTLQTGAVNYIEPKEDHVVVITSDGVYHISKIETEEVPVTI